jgi:hypothetical protein
MPLFFRMPRHFHGWTFDGGFNLLRGFATHLARHAGPQADGLAAIKTGR